MAFNFSANQFEQSYTAKRLCNWELPKWYPPRPRTHKRVQKFIANDHGHLLNCAKKVNASPWSNFRSTYELPIKLTREFADYYNECLLKRYKWSNYPKKIFICPDGTRIPPDVHKPDCPKKCETMQYLLSFDEMRNYQLHPCEKTEYNKKNSNNLEYTPGDFTPYNQQHASRDILLKDNDKYKHTDFNDESLKLPIQKLYMEEPDRKLESISIPPVKISSPLPQTTALINSLLSPRLPIEDHIKSREDGDNNPNKMFDSYHSITEKPNERCPSPVIPAYANFELARRMHQTNLDHQPLPDCVTDAAFRRLQITGSNPGLALDINPIATGVGVKTCNAGPTHCTKLKVFRPRTSGVVPRGTCHAHANERISSAHRPTKKMNAIDLAICWDYKPKQEPTLTRHIDGTNETAGPAVFTCVKPSPRTKNVGSRSGGVFSNTLGKSTFFDKDLMKHKLDFTGRRVDPEPYSKDDQLNLCPSMHVPRETSFGCLRNDEGLLKRYGKKYHSTPDILNNPEYKNLRQKYLGDDCDLMPAITTATTEPESTTCKRYNFLRRARSKFCHKVAPEPQCCNINTNTTETMCYLNNQSLHNHHLPCKATYRSKIPHYSANGDIAMHNGCCSNGRYRKPWNYNQNHHHHHQPSFQKVLVVPQPRIPYAKRNYDIITLVPPFTSYGGGAKQGGYPEHWRLASVYQHAYKPLEHRKRSFMQTVFK